MKVQQIIKWSSLTLSIISFSVFFFMGSFVDEQAQSVQDVEENEIKQQDQTEQPLNEEVLNYDENDCEGIINAFENQQDKKVENFSEGLLFNYQSCIKYGKPGNTNKEKQEVDEKSNNSQKDKSEKEKITDICLTFI